MAHEQLAYEDTPNDLTLQIEALRGDYPPEVNQRYNVLLSELHEKSQEHQDPYLQALCGTLLDKLDGSVYFNETLLLYLTENPTDNLPVSIRKIFSSCQEPVLPIPRMSEHDPIREKPLLDETYPEGYDKRGGKWKTVLDTIEDDTLASALFRLNLISKQLQSNILSRFAVQMVVPQLFGQTSTNRYIGGSSFGLDAKMEIYSPESEFRLPDYRIGALGGNNPKRPWFQVRTKEARKRRQDFLAMLRVPQSRLNTVLGVDLDPPIDPLTRSYGYSNGFRAPEYKNEWYRNIVAEMLLKQPPNMQILKGDFTETDHVDKIREKVPSWFNLPNRWANFSFSRYGLQPDQQDTTDANARKLVGRNGHRLDMDFVELGKDGKLKFLDRWPDWSCNVFVTPPGAERPLHIFRLRNGRALDIAAGADLPTTKDGLPILEFGIMADRASV